MRPAHILTILVMLAPLPVQAQSSDTDQAEIAIAGSVAPLCVIGEPSRPTVDLGQLIETSGTRVGRTRTIAAEAVLLPNSFCNFAGSVATIDATALIETASGSSAPPAGFSRAVNFTATVSAWGGGSTSASTIASASGAGPTASASSATQNTPRLTDLSVDLRDFTSPGDARPVAGNYSGLVRVTLGPTAVAN